MHPDQIFLRKMRQKQLHNIADMVWDNMHNLGTDVNKSYWKMGFMHSYFYFKGFEDDIIIE